MYAYIFSDDHEGPTGLSVYTVNIINKTDSLNPTNGEAFWTFMQTGYVYPQRIDKGTESSSLCTFLNALTFSTHLSSQLFSLFLRQHTAPS